MKNQAVIYALLALFALTIAAGLLSPQEAEVLLNRGVEISDAVVEESAEVDVATKRSDIVTPENSADALPANMPVYHPVLRVIDGDTIVVEIDGKSEIVRLIGIDTPETVHPSKSVECFGREASAKTKEWLEGQQVELVSDHTQGTRDKYHRLLAYVFRADGLFVNLELVRQGYAYEYTYNMPYQYQLKFQTAEAVARTNGHGLWGANTGCIDAT